MADRPAPAAELADFCERLFGKSVFVAAHTALECWEGHLFEAVNRRRRVRCRTRAASSAGDQLGPEVQDVLWVRGSGLRCDGYSFRWLPVAWRVVRQRASTSVRAGGFQRSQRFERSGQVLLRV